MLPRKFYRLDCLSDIFLCDSDDVFKTNDDGMGGFNQQFLDEMDGLIDKHTILFITATDEDNGKYVKIPSTSNGKTTLLTYKIRPCDTMIWARGRIFAISTKTVVSVVFDSPSSSLVVWYSDSTFEKIKISTQGGGSYTAGDNIIISDSNVISALGYLFDTEKNFIEDPESNNVTPGVLHSHVEGYNNFSSADCQHVQGKFAKVDPDKAFIIGWGSDDNNRDNIFTVTMLGVVYTPTDVTCGGISEEHPDYRLQDIHSVFDSDWVLIGFDDNSFDDEHFNDSYK